MLGMLSSACNRQEISPPHCHHCRQCQDIHYVDGGCATRWLESDDSNPMGRDDSPGIRRYNTYLSPVSAVRPSARVRRTSQTPFPRAVSPFCSATSGLNSILEPSSHSHASSSRTRTQHHVDSNAFQVTVTPSHTAISPGVSFLIAPHPDNAVEEEESHNVNGNAGGE
jgi:hypothetical protein